MGSHQFDKQIKDKLQFHKMDIPDGMWEKIEAGLPQKNKNRRLPFIGFAAMAAALFLFMFSAYYISHYSGYAINLKKEKQKNIRKSASRESAMIDAGDNNLPFADAYNRTIVTETKITDNTNTETSAVNSRSVKFVTEATAFTPERETDNTTFQHYPTLVTSTEEKAETTIRVEDNGTLSAITFPTLESRLNFIQGTGNVKRSLPKDECLANFDRSGQGIFMDLYYGNDLPIRSLKARDANFEKLAEARAESETPLYSFSLGARLGFNLNKNVNLMTGIHYSRINEKFEFVDPESSQTKVVKTTLYIKDGQGNIKDSTFTFDTIFIPGTLVYKIRNQYTSLDIPFLVGYRLLQKEKISLTLNAGIMANLLFTQEGMALMQDQYTVRSFDDRNESNFHHSLGFSTYASAQFLYALVPDFHLFLEPSIRFQHRDMTTKDYPISQHYTTISFLTGARYNF